jgi:hypothetical protein
MSELGKVTEEHRRRRAVVYMRQSSVGQVGATPSPRRVSTRCVSGRSSLAGRPGRSRSSTRTPADRARAATDSYDLAALAVLHDPANGVAAEDVEDHVEIEARPLRRTLELGDVHEKTSFGRSASNSVRRRAGGPAGRAAQHAAMLGGQQPVHRARRRQVAALVQQRRPDLRGRAVNDPLGMQLGQDGRALGLRQRASRRLSGPRR